MVSRVCRISKCIADEVEADGDNGQNDGRNDQLISEGGSHHKAAALVDQVAQGRGVDGETQADVCKEYFGTDSAGDGQSHAEHDDGNHLGQQVLHDDLAGGGTEASGGKVEVSVSDDEYLVSDETCQTYPSGDGHCNDDGPHAGAHDVGCQDQNDGGRDVVDQVVDLGKEPVKSSDITPEEAGQNTDDCFDSSDDDTDLQRSSGTGPHSGPQVLTDIVGTEEEYFVR